MTIFRSTIKLEFCINFVIFGLQILKKGSIATIAVCCFLIDCLHCVFIYKIKSLRNCARFCLYRAFLQWSERIQLPKTYVSNCELLHMKRSKSIAFFKKFEQNKPQKNDCQIRIVYDACSAILFHSNTQRVITVIEPQSLVVFGCTLAWFEPTTIQHGPIIPEKKNTA